MSRSLGIERHRALKKLLIAIALVVLAVVALAAGMLFAELRLTLRERELVRNARDAGRALAAAADREGLLQAGSSPVRGEFDKMAHRLVTPDSEVVYLDLIDADGEIVWSSEPQDEDRRWQGGRPASFLAGSRQRTRVPGVSEDEPDVFLEMVTAVGSDGGRGAVVLGLSEARLAARLARGFWPRARDAGRSLMNDRSSIHVLLVEDDEAGRRSVERFLEDSGYSVSAVGDGEKAEALFREQDFSVLVADYRLPGIDGIELVRRVKACRPACPCLLVTAHGDVRSAVEAMRSGAVHFIEKPVQPALLVELIDEAWEKHALRLEVDRLRRQLDERYGFHQIVGSSPAMAAVFQRIKLAAPTSSTILITGESGTGKELVARALHQNSLRKHGPFVAINCAALPESLVATELFGHEKGAFTGAAAGRKGFFEAAEHGTLLIDEIGDMPLALQPNLLRALEQRSIHRVGSTGEVPVDVRIIAATHQRLEEKVEDGSFRADLYYRLAVLRIDVPPLRQRREDIPLLFASFLQQLSGEEPVPPISPQALDALCCYGWPGNVRELRNVAESLLVLSSGRIERPAPTGTPDGTPGTGRPTSPTERLPVSPATARVFAIRGTARARDDASPAESSSRRK